MEGLTITPKIEPKIEPKIVPRKSLITGSSIRKSITVLLLSTILFSCDREDKRQGELLVGAAASLEHVMQELTTIYKEQNPEVTVNFTYAGSGSLEQQIREGAPIDLFLSAAQIQMDALEEDEFILSETRVNLIENQIVLIVPEDSQVDIVGFDDILEASMIALGNPDSVPVGRYAQELFEALGIWEEVYAKSTFGKDVTEVLAWVSSGNSEAGVVYATDALLSNDVKVIAIAPAGSHSRSIYPAAVIKGTKKELMAKDFIQFLQTKEAKDVFIQYGFTIID